MGGSRPDPPDLERLLYPCRYPVIISIAAELAIVGDERIEPISKVASQLRTHYCVTPL